MTNCDPKWTSVVAVTANGVRVLGQQVALIRTAQWRAMQRDRLDVELALEAGDIREDQAGVSATLAAELDRIAQ